MQSFLLALLLLSVLSVATSHKVRYSTDFFCQLTNVTFDYLQRMSYQLLIVDPDLSGLTLEQNTILRRQGKTVLAYLSLGEA